LKRIKGIEGVQMTKTKISEGGTRDKILDAAQQIFTQYGYEDTGVRMILAKADVVTGSFYHFFKSKEDLFEAVVERFLQQHESRIMSIVQEDLSFSEKINQILNLTEQNSITYHQDLKAGTMHWTIQYVLHKKTMQAIAPAMELLIHQMMQEGRITNPLQMDECTLAAVALQGLEGILHAKAFDEMNQEEQKKVKQDSIRFLSFILGLTE